MGTMGSYQIWIPFFRFCRVSEDKIEITPSIFFGCSFVFDSIRQAVFISRQILRVSISNIEVPFSDISCHLQSRDFSDSWVGGLGGGSYSPGGTTYTIEVTARHGRRFKIAEISDGHNARRIFEAIWIMSNRKAIHEEVLRNPGISHTELLRRFAGDRVTKEAAVRELLDTRELKCERRGRVRRYYTYKRD